MRIMTSAIASVLVLAIAGEAANAVEPPPIPREFRAAWIATVANIDWPTKPGLGTQAQKKELSGLLDRAQALNLNAIIFQVRPAADALYDSKLEPWSPYLTGTMGRAPSPAYDPLEFAVTEAHRRGLELHVWFNPYRALHKAFDGDVAEDHISVTHPAYVREYDGYLWLDPGSKAAMRHSLDVIADVVRRYDIDGVHLDDYFYPYPIRDDDGNQVPFPDDASWQSAETQLSRDDWRRQNVNQLIKELYFGTKTLKPWVKVGISPFGIWRPGHPEGIKGFDAYAEIYADAKKWLQEGWLDYVTPQLYWKIESEGQSYPKLLEWWHEQNTWKRHLWPGNFASRVGMQGERAWDASEIINQIEATRSQEGATGNVHFSMKALLPNYGPLGEALSKPYATQALVPASPWLGEDVPKDVAVLCSEFETKVELKLRADNPPWLWGIQSFRDGEWHTTIVPGQQDSIELPIAERFVTTMISRTGVSITSEPEHQ